MNQHLAQLKREKKTKTLNTSLSLERKKSRSNNCFILKLSYQKQTSKLYNFVQFYIKGFISLSLH